MLSTVGYTTVLFEVEGDGDVYSRSATAWFELRAGMDVSSVALGTEEELVLEAMEEWSSVHQP
jgi:hypothetical protein